MQKANYICATQKWDSIENVTEKKSSEPNPLKLYVFVFHFSLFFQSDTPISETQSAMKKSYMDESCSLASLLNNRSSKFSKIGFTVVFIQKNDTSSNSILNSCFIVLFLYIYCIFVYFQICHLFQNLICN